ncbi:MAG: cupin domain-containing protein [Rhodospirillaceae bacterium]
MAIEIIDVVEVGKREKKRTRVFDTRKMHAWVHYYPNPGDHDDMHCHNEDQTFICFEGQCTMHFPDGSKSELNPGMAALIRGGSFYRLENTGQGPMIMMGNRSGQQDNIKIIDYETRRDVRQIYGDGKVHIHNDGSSEPMGAG